MSPSQISPVADGEQRQAPAEPHRAAPAVLRLPELLAPAGDWDCARAAVENGADAIYFGLAAFNARMRARNFTEADLPRLMEFLHRRGVKGYLTFNILVFENEMALAEQYVRAMIAAGVDAAVVQDAGICRLIRQLSPDFPIHASTQMTITSAAGVAFARELGCSLVVLARECSLKEIEKIVMRVAEQAQGPAVSSPEAPCYDQDRLTCDSLSSSGGEGRGEEADSSDRPEHASPPTNEPLSLTLSPHAGRGKTPGTLGGDRVDLRHSSPEGGPCQLPPDTDQNGALESSPVARPAPRPSSLPIEVFVHGALCVAYSGQCLTSEALGGRSANRGECAQACRMPYDLIADGNLVPLGDRKYLLSPQDLAGLEVLPDLVRAGVASLKIEGRLKSPEYVANITRIYRQALDKLAQATGPTQSAAPDGPRAVGRFPHYEMEMAFSRGLYTGWFRGTNNQRLVHGRFGKKRGVYLGQVTAVHPDSVVLRLEGPLKPGDGVVFDAGKPEEKEEGGRVYEIRAREASRLSAKRSDRGPETSQPGGTPVWLTFGRNAIDFSRVHVGDKLWKTSDPELERRLRQSFAGDTPRFQRPVAMEVHGLAGQPLTLIARDELGHVVRVDSARSLNHTQEQSLTLERLRQQLGRLGGTPFKLGELNDFLPDGVGLPVSELNHVRREAVRELESLRARPKRWQLHASAVGYPASESRPVRQAALGAPHLIVLVRNLAQLQAALNSGVPTLYCEFEDPKKYREAVQIVRTARGAAAASGQGQPEIFVAPPRVFKMGEEWTLRQVRSCGADGYLVRNYDHLDFFAHDRRVGDYSLNVANGLAADYFKNKYGLERVTASYDLNFGQLEALLRAAPPEWFEVTIHQHMPMFHMEHCVFCAFLSQGTDFTNCGRPCDRHEVKLRDRVGAEHPVKADVGCRNTVFNALSQTGAEYVPKMLALGARHFRLEFLNETPEQVGRTIGKYGQLLRGEISGAQVWRELKLLNQLGVTRGQIGGQRG